MLQALCFQTAAGASRCPLGASIPAKTARPGFAPAARRPTPSRRARIPLQAALESPEASESKPDTPAAHASAAPHGDSKKPAATVSAYKRLVVLADGTWKDEASETPSNILKLAKSLAPESDDGVHQVMYYDSGVGTGGAVDRFFGGALGVGIDAKIKEIYIWLACNYAEGDEVYMFGFSRGSYTVRSLAGLMYNCGLVRQEEISFVDAAYEMYRERGQSPDEDVARDFRARHSIRPNVGERVPITLLACFDTVGALGLPDQVFFGSLDDARYAFHDTKLSDTIQNAVHLLSVDEERGAFQPTLMKENKRVPGQLTELFFPGRHSGVGGGEPTEIGLSDYSLAWLVSEIKRRGMALKFHVDRLEEGTVDVPPPSPPSLGDRARAVAFNAVSGRYVRKVDSVERCDSSVAKRYALQPGWRPEALEKTGKDLARLGKELLSDHREDLTQLLQEKSDKESAKVSD